MSAGPRVRVRVQSLGFRFSVQGSACSVQRARFCLSLTHTTQHANTDPSAVRLLRQRREGSHARHPRMKIRPRMH
eukprot:2982035-Rhodomonas_salina.1